MALSFGFYNRTPTDPEGDYKYDAIQMGQIFDGLITDGVYATFLQSLIVVASDPVAANVIVQPGRAWFNHTWTYNDANLPIEAPDPEVILDRIDALVLDIDSDLGVRKNTIQWVTGEPTSQNPAKPTLIHTDTHNQYALCYVRRYGDTYTIRQDDIENAIGTSETPFVSGIIENSYNVDQLLLQWTAEFNTYIRTKQDEFSQFQTTMENAIYQYEQETEASFFAWMESEKTSYYQWLADNRTAWVNWFSHIQYELDGDVAGHLQQQIDNISFIYVVNETLFLPMTSVSVQEAQEKAIFINLNNNS